jgi:hypothetical protein
MSPQPSQEGAGDTARGLNSGTLANRLGEAKPGQMVATG